MNINEKEEVQSGSRGPNRLLGRGGLSDIVGRVFIGNGSVVVYSKVRRLLTIFT